MAHRLATLVTGASSGIGAALAASFAREPSRVLILVARRTAPMHALADELKTRFGTETQVIEADLEVPGAASKLLEQVDQLGLTVDTLINNAGFGLNGPLHEMTLARVSGMLQLNITALTELTHGVLPAMRARRSGRILNIASVAAFQRDGAEVVYKGLGRDGGGWGAGRAEANVGGGLQRRRAAGPTRPCGED